MIAGESRVATTDYESSISSTVITGEDSRKLYTTNLGTVETPSFNGEVDMDICYEQTIQNSMYNYYTEMYSQHTTKHKGGTFTSRQNLSQTQSTSKWNKVPVSVTNSKDLVVSGTSSSKVVDFKTSSSSSLGLGTTPKDQAISVANTSLSPTKRTMVHSTQYTAKDKPLHSTYKATDQYNYHYEEVSEVIDQDFSTTSFVQEDNESKLFFFVVVVVIVCFVLFCLFCFVCDTFLSEPETFSKRTAFGSTVTSKSTSSKASLRKGCLVDRVTEAESTYTTTTETSDILRGKGARAVTANAEKNSEIVKKVKLREEVHGGWFWDEVRRTWIEADGSSTPQTEKVLNNCSGRMISSVGSGATALLMSKNIKDIDARDISSLGVSVAESGVLGHVSTVAGAMPGVAPVLGALAVGAAATAASEITRSKINNTPSNTTSRVLQNAAICGIGLSGMKNSNLAILTTSHAIECGNSIITCLDSSKSPYERKEAGKVVATSALSAGTSMYFFLLSLWFFIFVVVNTTLLQVLELQQSVLLRVQLRL